MSFEDIEMSSEIREAIKRMNYDKATDVQVDTIPLMMAGHNVIVKSHTGSGKTAAFGIPVSENIFKGRSTACLVLCPTRELAVQVKEELKKINSKTRLRVEAFYGGHGMASEERAAEKGVDILCATPGRLLDHFRNGNLAHDLFDTVVLDEADRMLDMGFIPDLKQILNYVQPKHTHLFSATLDGSVAQLIHEYIPEYEEVLLHEEIVGKNIFERHVKVPRDKRIDALIEILKEAGNNRVLVFVSTKHSADFLSKKLYQRGYDTASIHGGKSQKAREMALKNFKLGKRNIMVATDVAARGLQIDNVEFVVNYDLAGDADMHKHRIGRTGRMGGTGHAITFTAEDGSIIAPPRMFGRASAANRGYSGYSRGGQGSRNQGGRRDFRPRMGSGGPASRGGPSSPSYGPASRPPRGGVHSGRDRRPNRRPHNKGFGRRDSRN